MKRLLRALAIAAALSACVAGHAESAVTTEVGTFTPYRPERFCFARHAIIGNPLNYYSLAVVQTKGNSEKPQENAFSLSSGNRFSFSGPTEDFLKMTVNGFAMKFVNVSEDMFSEWKEEGRGGVDMKINFDGAKIIFRWHMRGDSPVLWCTVSPAPDGIEPVKSATLKLSWIQSAIAYTPERQTLWENAYAREAVTATRTMTQKSGNQELAPDDRYLILRDAIFDGSTPEKGVGPCFIVLDFKEVDKAFLTMGNTVWGNLAVELKPGFSSFTFGLWQHKVPRSNAAFMEQFEKNRQAFLCD